VITFEECGLTRRQGFLLCVASVPAAVFVWLLMVAMAAMA
jgi:hypothetical protein